MRTDALSKLGKFKKKSLPLRNIWASPFLTLPPSRRAVGCNPTPTAPRSTHWTPSISLTSTWLAPEKWGWQVPRMTSFYHQQFLDYALHCCIVGWPLSQPCGHLLAKHAAYLTGGRPFVFYKHKAVEKQFITNTWKVARCIGWSFATRL
jgi:hypothetical protein